MRIVASSLLAAILLGSVWAPAAAIQPEIINPAAPVARQDVAGPPAPLPAPSVAREPACPDRPGAIGTSRTLVLDSRAYQRIGRMQYPMSLPLAPKEVVLTFDDGPLPPFTNRVLDTLARECVKATFFLVGRMARAHPEMVRRIAAAGHTIATHTENHPFDLPRTPPERGIREIESGIASIATALGDAGRVAPFFRFPGLLRTEALERHMQGRGLSVWSADLPVDDWLKISPDEVLARALQRIEARQGGVVLLHDIQSATVLALPRLLAALRERGYRIVHVVPEAPDPRAVPGAPPVADSPATGAAPTAGSGPAQQVPWPRIPPPGRKLDDGRADLRPTLRTVAGIADLRGSLP